MVELSPEQYQQLQSNQLDVSNLPYHNPMRTYGNSINLLTDPSSTIAKLELTFRNVAETQKGEVIELGKPLMNDYGISVVLGIVNSIVNQVSILSNIDHKEKVGLYMHFCDRLAVVLMMNTSTFDIQSFSARDLIYTESCFLVYMTLNRPQNNEEKKFWSKIVQEVKSTIESNQKNKGGGIGNILGWNKHN